MIIAKGNTIQIKSSIDYMDSPVVEAKITIKDPDGNIIVDNELMEEKGNNAFVYNFDILADYPNGWYLVEVNVETQDGMKGREITKIRIEDIA